MDMGAETGEMPLIILSAGGTGGHMTPALALSRDLLARGYRVEMLTDSRGLTYQVQFGDMKVHRIEAGTAPAGLLAKAAGLSRLALGIAQAGWILARKRPALVVGFGGYPSFPGVYAAQRLGITTLLHEQNAVTGKANRLLARRADRIALSLPDVQGLSEHEKSRAVFTGNPVRADIAALYTEPYPAFHPSGPLRIFIVGGSLGARIFSEIIPEALAALSQEHRQRLQITQQVREESMDAVRAAYHAAGIKADLKSFFTDVAPHLAQAHLVISRSGASTVAEVTTAGRPAIFVPYPHHADQQQKINADAVADAGGAWVMTEEGFKAEALRVRIENFLHNPDVLFRAAEKSRSCGRPDAARKLGNLVTSMISGWG